jgi:hypothetical protein
VAAGEQQLEALVGDCGLIHLELLALGQVEQPELRCQRAVATDPVDRAVPSRRDQPGPWVRGRAVARPARRRQRERLLRGFLGEVEVAEEADQGGEDAAPFLPEDLVEDC